MSGLGVLLGPTLGGFIVTNVGWRWIFFLNIPIGIVAIALAFVFMPDVRPGVRHRLDVPGVLLLTAGLFGVVFGLIEGERYDWGTVAGFLTIPLVIAIGVVLLGLFLWRQVRTQDAEPLLPFAVFTDRTFTVMTLVLLAMGFAMVGRVPAVDDLLPVGAGADGGGGRARHRHPVAGHDDHLRGRRRALRLRAGQHEVGAVRRSAAVRRPGWSTSSRWPHRTPGSGRSCPAWSRPVSASAASGRRCSAWRPATCRRPERVSAPGCWTPCRSSVRCWPPPCSVRCWRTGSAALVAVAGAAAAAGAAGAGPGAVPAGHDDGRFRRDRGRRRAGVADRRCRTGVPAPVAEQVHAAAQHVFAAAFTDAMRPTMVVPIVVILLAAVAVLFVRSAPAEPARPLTPGRSPGR